MIMWTCRKCQLLIVPDGTTPADVAKAMKEHVKVCTKADR